jgi:hypothetical protein
VRLFRMPKPLLAFVDETRAWVKSDVGTSIDWVPRESSFSARKTSVWNEARIPVVTTDHDPHLIDAGRLI